MAITETTILVPSLSISQVTDLNYITGYQDRWWCQQWPLGNLLHCEYWENFCHACFCETWLFSQFWTLRRLIWEVTYMGIPTFIKFHYWIPHWCPSVYISYPCQGPNPRDYLMQFSPLHLFEYDETHWDLNKMLVILKTKVDIVSCKQNNLHVCWNFNHELCSRGCH